MRSTVVSDAWGETMSADMTERRQLLLRLVIQEFVETATPVSSRALVERYGLGYSTATVRNELAMLEELGYLTHRHTSDGRVPTDAGYRYFVENLMERAPLSVAEQRTIRHQFYQVPSELYQWIELAGAVLARTTRSASLVTPPRLVQTSFKHVELIGIHDTLVLLVLVLQDGTVRQQTFFTDRVYSQDELRRASMQLCERAFEASVVQLEELLGQERQAEPPALDPLALLSLAIVVNMMRQHDDQLTARVHSDGLMEILDQPEFNQVERVRQMLQILQSGRLLGPLIPQALASEGVQVLIGGEHGIDEMREYSVVLARYGATNTAAGVLGIIGPTRMPYPRSISTVRYISTVMSDLLCDLHGRDRGRAQPGR